MEYEEMETGLNTSSQEESVTWSGVEVDSLIDSWCRNAKGVNQPRNEVVMNMIAEDISTGKTAKQVRNKLKKMRCRYSAERDKINKGMCSRWRYYEKMNGFNEHIIKNPNRRGPSSHSDHVEVPKSPIKVIPRFTAAPSYLASRARLPVESNVNINSPSVADAHTVVKLLSTLKPQPITQFPPVYPYDSDVPANVTISEQWGTWNANLHYPLTDNGVRAVIRSGFSDVSHLSLLRGRGANVAMLNLNYHDKLALEHALEAEAQKPQQIQVISSDGSVVELQSYSEQDQAALLTNGGIKMAEWNKDLSSPLSSSGLIAIIKAGFISPDDVTTLLREEDIDAMDMNLRDRAAMRRLITDSTTAAAAAATSAKDNLNSKQGD